MKLHFIYARLHENRSAIIIRNHSQIIAISSGKGGVGKTSVCANLGLLLCNQNLTTCVIDADHGLANINITLGLPPANHGIDVYSEPEKFARCIQRSKFGFDVLSTSSGVSIDSDPAIPGVEQIAKLFDLLSRQYDVVLVDTAAGINRSVRNYLALADFVILIITTEPTSLTDSFGLIRKMQSVNDSYEIVTNRVNGVPQANQIYRRFSNAVKKYIGLDISHMGYINEDPNVSIAVLRQSPIVHYRPDSTASYCLRRISQTIARNIHWKRVRPKVKHNPSALPTDPTFMAQDQDSQPDAFEQWLQHLPQFFGSSTDTTEERVNRFNKFREKILLMLDKNRDFNNEFIKFADSITNKPISLDPQKVRNQEIISRAEAADIDSADSLQHRKLAIDCATMRNTKSSEGVKEIAANFSTTKGCSKTTAEKVLNQHPCSYESPDADHTGMKNLLALIQKMNLPEV